MRSDSLFLPTEFEPGQPLDELSLSFVPRTNRGETAVEILPVVLLRGQRLKIGKQTGRPIVARCVAAFDLLLDLTPDARAALPERIEPDAARLFFFLGLSASFCFQAFGQSVCAGRRDRLRPRAQCSSRAV